MGHHHHVAAFVVVALVALVRFVASQGECSETTACPDNTMCCSQYNYCGTGDAYCGEGCKNGPCNAGGTPPAPVPPTSGSGWSSFFTEEVFVGWFPSRNADFYTFERFKAAASAYPTFGNEGSVDDQKREIAAFFGNVNQESGGLKFVRETNPTEIYCDTTNTQYPCAAGKSYYGRGPIQLSWNYNYGACGDALNLPLLANPELVETDADVAFKTALWFWMTNQCHQAIIGPPPSFGKTIRIINGAKECDLVNDERVTNRVTYYTNFCNSLGVDPGTDLRC
jgi:chitinase